MLPKKDVLIEDGKYTSTKRLMVRVIKSLNQVTYFFFGYMFDGIGYMHALMLDRK
jgi:hypothetical protein